MKFDELSVLMRENGIVGAGGAGFPSYAKLKNEGIDTIILNCAECEPLLRLHRQLMEKKAYEIISTLDLIAKTIGASKVIIGVKSAYTKAISAIEANLAPFNNIHICPLNAVYPAGDEVVLIHEATGKIVPPGALPASVGIIVYNVETVYNIYRALSGDAVTHKFVTVAGEVKKPQTFFAPIGMEFGELVDLAGGETVEGAAYLVGGPMMGSLGNRFDVVTKTTNAIIVLPQDHYVVLRKQVKPAIDMKRAMAACCQCRYCTDMCPRHLLGHPIEPHEFMRVVSNRDSHDLTPYLNAMFCSGCGLCEMYSCGQGLSPRALIGEFKKGFRAAGIPMPKYEGKVKSVRDSEYRRVPVLRLASRIGLSKYNKSAPIVETEITPETVKILLTQHIGVPAAATVKKGDSVKCGDVIGKAVEGKLGVNIHSSVNGKVVDVNEKFVIIRTERA